MKELIKELENEGELIRVKTPVSPTFEMTEIVDRIAKTQGGGKAILFENTGTSFPVLMNLFGSDKRMQKILGVESWSDLQKRLSTFMASFLSPPSGWIDKLKILLALKQVAGIFPKIKRGRGRCQEVVMSHPDLTKLPILTCWPHDGGPFITLPVVITKDPDTGIRNVGMYRMQRFSENTSGMHWHRHKVAARHFREYKKMEKRMPIAVILGGDPLYTYCATAPLPDHADEFALAGFLRQKPVRLVKALTQDIEVPEDADVVIEGYVDPKEQPVWEGPFGDHTGFYSLPDWYPMFHVTAITHRKDAIYPATIVGIPPMEDAYLGKATEQIFLKPIQLAIAPEVQDMLLPVQGVAHNLVLIKIDKTYPGQAVKVMNALWGAGQMMFSKVLVVVDKYIDLNNTQQVLEAVAENVNVWRDFHTSQGPLDILDHASSSFSLGSKLGIDATAPLPEEKSDLHIEAPNLSWNGSCPEEIARIEALPYTGSCNFIGACLKDSEVDKNQVIKRLLAAGELQGSGYIVLVDEYADLNEMNTITWLALGNLDPHRDLYIRLDDQSGMWRVLIDATMKTRKTDNYKRNWPNVITMSPEVIELVDRRWNEYDLGAFVSSPSHRFRGLSKVDSFQIKEQ